MYLKKTLLSFLLTSLCITFCFSQISNTISHSVYIAGNTSGLSDTRNLAKLTSAIQKETSPVTVIYCGDIIKSDGLTDDASADDSAFIKSLLAVGNNKSDVSVYFIPGDLDWNNSGKRGWKAVKNLEKLVNVIAGKKVFLPGDGCPGPEVITIGENLDIIFISTPWLIHPHERPYIPDDDCKVLTEAQFKEQLTDVIEESKEKNLLVVGHHPVFSYGTYGGKVSFIDHFAPPVIGTFKAGYHQNIGSTKDMAYPAYKNFAEDMRNIMQDFAPFIYASAHDYNMQVIGFENSYQVVSGAIAKNKPAGKAKNTIFKSAEPGFISLAYYDNGKVVMNAYEIDMDEPQHFSKELYQSACEADGSGAPVNTRYVPCREKIILPENMNPAFADSFGAAVAGPQYKAAFFKKLFLGKLYRTSWTTQINVPFLNLDTTKGGLTATGIGGGRQTKSLSFDGADGKFYVFRSVDKDPIKALDPILRKTFVVGLTRQFTATQHPYGAMPVSYLLDSTSVYHAQPVLFILPDDSKLGLFQKKFGGMLGMLEEKPKKAKDNRPGTFGADDVVRSFELFRKLYKDHDNRIDEKAFLKARIFDMWIGDWGRHEDNWKWAGFKSENNRIIYSPIPRDRDHAFSVWNGMLPYFVSRRWALPNAENFGHHFADIRSLTFPARHLDRLLLTSLQKKEWLAVAAEIKSTMNDKVIDSAIRQFPQEIIPLSGNKIGSKLKTRRDELEKAAEKYYYLLAKNVNVLGSNKAENFLIERLTDNTVEVTMWAKEKNKEGEADTILYHRVFYCNETKHINVYGLDGDDSFTIRGSSSRSVAVRVFGGKGNDVITNTSTVKHGSNATRIYEYKSENKNEIIAGDNSKVIVSDDKTLVEYNRQPAHYDTYLPLPLLYFTKEDGLEFGLGVSYVFHRFGEDGYTNRLRVSDRFSTEGNIQVKITDEFHHLFGKWDLLLGAELAQPYRTTYFYGAGNETEKLLSVPAEYYRSRIYGYNAFTGLQRIFWKKSSFTIGLNYESNDARILAGNFLAESETVFGRNQLDFFGVHSGIDIDFRDNTIFPRHGARFFASQTFSHFNISDSKDFGNSEVTLELYQTSRTLLPITIGVKGGFTNATGDVPFYKLNTLGRTSGLRGYDRDRFAGNTTARINTQIAFEFGTVQTSVLPVTYGVYCFYDAGRVWVRDESSDKIHAGYGAGIYLTPLLDIFTTRISVSFSDESKKGLFEAGLGIGF